MNENKETIIFIVIITTIIIIFFSVYFYHEGYYNGKAEIICLPHEPIKMFNLEDKKSVVCSDKKVYKIPN